MADNTVARTPNPDCPECVSRERHVRISFRLYHPYAKHGYTKEGGWTHPDLAPKEPGK